MGDRRSNEHGARLDRAVPTAGPRTHPGTSLLFGVSRMRACTAVIERDPDMGLFVRRRLLRERPSIMLHLTKRPNRRTLYSGSAWTASRVSAGVNRQGGIVTVKRMDNVGIVVEDIDAAIEFFAELGLILEGRMPIEGEWAGRVTGVRGQRVEIAMMRTPDGHGRLELSRFDAPAIASDHRTAPVNSLGYLRVMFTVEDIEDTLARLRELGATVVDEVVNYEDIYRLCYIRGPEGILLGLAQQLGQEASRENPMERER